jgi:hypothetical protein
MKRTYLSTILLAAAVTMSAGAMAAGDAPSKESRPAPSADRNPKDRTVDTTAMTFKSLDTNKDGYISKQEAKASNGLNQQFSQLDKDHDGKLSSQELASWKDDGHAQAQTAGRSKLPRAPRQEPGTTGSTEPGAGAGMRSVEPGSAKNTPR